MAEVLEKGDYLCEEAAQDGVSIPDHLVVVTADNSGSEGGESKVFHTSVCGCFPGRAKAISKEIANAWGYRECYLCADDVDPTDGDYSYLASLKAAAEADGPVIGAGEGSQ
jgi:hypothetical protein